jgi:hypothetical protein
MQSLSVSAVARRAPRPRAALQVALALATATALASGMAGVASAACPWIVQPEAQKVAAGAGAAPSFDIVFEGLDQNSKVFYGFTVASLDLAWQLANRGALPRLATDARRLEPRLTPYGTTAYRLAPDTIRPPTIYLVAADKVVRELEQLEARIEPARPLAVSELMPQLQPRTRGGTDWSGPLPRRSLPGFEIAGAERTPAAAGSGGIGPVNMKTGQDINSIGIRIFL